MPHSGCAGPPGRLAAVASARRRLWAGVVALAASLPAVASAQSGTIVDPENPIFEAEPAPAPADGRGVIVDPQNPALAAPAEDGADEGLILDPENPGLPTSPALPTSPPPFSDPAPLPTAEGFRPQVAFRGELESVDALDLVHDDAVEDTIELQQRLTLWTRYRFAERWSATLEGRLTWRVTAGGDADDPVVAPDGDRWQGHFEPQLRELFVSGRAGDWLLRAGQLSIVWGSSDLTKPADVINPYDYRHGFLSDPADGRIPVPALDATWVRDRLAVQFVLVPFFVPHRFSLYGSDTAIFRPGRPMAQRVPLAGLSTLLFDPSTEDVVQPAIQQTALPEELPQNASLGARVTSSYGGWDVSLGYFFGWDRFPTVRMDDRLRAFLDDVTEADGTLRPLEPIDLLPHAELFEDALSGVRLLEARYERRHVVEVDGVHYFGPVGLRFESAFSPARTFYGADFESLRRPSLFSSLGLSWEADAESLLVTVEVFDLHVFGEAGDPELAYLGGATYWGVVGALSWVPGSVAAGASWLDDVELRLMAYYAPVGRDVIAAPALSWRGLANTEIGLGAVLAGSLDRESATAGDLYAGNDQLVFRLARTF